MKQSIISAIFVILILFSQQVFSRTAEEVLENMESVVRTFEENKSIEDCIYLTQRYAGLRGDEFDKKIVNYVLAIKYGEICIEEGVNNTPAGWAVNLWLAHVYHQRHDSKQAGDHLNMALALDTNKK